MAVAGKRSWVWVGLTGVFLWFVFLWVSDFALIKAVELRYHVKIAGKYFPSHWLPGRFQITDPKIEWKNDLKITSGIINVHADALSVKNKSLTVSLRGKDLQVTMKKKSYPVHTAEATLEFQSSGEPILHSFNVDSPILQIQILEKSHEI